MIQSLKKVVSHLFPLVVIQEKGEVTEYLEVRLEKGRRVLNSSKVNYSYGGLHKVFKEVFSKHDLSSRKIENILILGFGAGSVASLLREEKNLSCPITGVEQDKVVVRLTNEYFQTEIFSPFTLINEDAYHFVMNTTQKFDLIVVDLFVEDKVPEQFKRKAFFEKLNQLLTNDGILFFNKMPNSQEQMRNAEGILSHFNQIFGDTQVEKINVNGKVNWVYVFDRETFNNNPLILKRYTTIPIRTFLK